MRKNILLFVVLLCGLAARSAAAQSNAAEMTIDDMFPTPGTGLQSDGHGTYYDNSLPSFDNPCVTAQVASNGIFSARIDFNPLLYPSVPDCDMSLSSLEKDDIRAFNLWLLDSFACAAVLGPTQAAPCTVPVTGKSIDKIFAGGLFASAGFAGTPPC
jgi:hypothetical protein